MIGAQSDSIGRGADGSKSEKESGTLESRALRGTQLVSGSIVVEVAVLGAASNRPSPTGAVGSKLMLGADT